jgi:transcription elongation factor Elf1
MTCPQCNSEMSKKWHPSAAKVTAGTAVVWACGVCGWQLTQADMKLSTKHAAEPLLSGSTAT